MADAAYPIRPIAEAEFPAFYRSFVEAFNADAHDGDMEVARPVYDPQRMLAAFDGTQIIGTAGAFGFRMALPGGPAPVAGVTSVGVAATHRRQGVLRDLMHRQLTDLHETGEAVAALGASEAGIYGRYGYGRASRHMLVDVRRGESAYVPDVPTDEALRLRAVDPQRARPELAAVYDAQLAERPGQFARDAAWWTRRLHYPERGREPGFGALRCVLAEDGGGPRGYALFAMRLSGDADGLPGGTLAVHELYARDPAAYALLWRHVLHRDLIASVTAALPVDDPLQHLLLDSRRLRARVTDWLWVRLVDVDRALPLRAYSAEVDVVIEVDDPVCPWNAGRWHLATGTTGNIGAAGAQCTRTRRAADVALPVQTLGAAFLGDQSLTALARAGLVEELHDGAVRELSRAFSWDTAPYCPLMF